MELIELFGIHFGIIDVVFIAILLITLIVGTCKGLVNFVLSSFKGVISLIAATLLCKPGAKIVDLLFGKWISSELVAWINAVDPLFTTKLPGGDANTAIIENGLEHLKLPGFINNLIAKGLSGTTAETLGEALTAEISGYVMITISFVVICILSRIILFILRKAFKKLIKKRKTIKKVDKWFGAFAGIVLGVGVISIIAIVFSYFANSPALETIANFLKEDMLLGDDNAKTFSKFIYDNNPLLYILDLL